MSAAANFCTSTQVKVEQHVPYQFEISRKDNWSFLGATSGPGGMTVSWLLPRKDDGWLDSAIGLARATFLSLAYPIKRSFDRPFGRVILRYGETGNEENFVDSDEDPGPVDHLQERFKPTRDGELYVYLNKPVSRKLMRPPRIRGKHKFVRTSFHAECVLSKDRLCRRLR
jgi:hypothetical protein